MVAVRAMTIITSEAGKLSIVLEAAADADAAAPQRVAASAGDGRGGSNAEIYFKRVAVLASQIDEWSLPTRPTKITDSRAKNFGSISVELDAIPPDRLRALASEAIEFHLPQDQYQKLKAAEESERELLDSWVTEATQ
jgi:hypothetical protein